MALNDTYVEAADALGDTNELIVDASTTDTGDAEIVELGGTGDAEIYKETDVGGDGTYEVSVQISGPSDSTNPTTGTWHYQDNSITVSQSANHRIRIVNVSGGTADFYATGFEVGN